MKANPHKRTHPKVVSVPHGWWLPEAEAPEYGVFEGVLKRPDRR